MHRAAEVRRIEIPLVLACSIMNANVGSKVIGKKESLSELVEHNALNRCTHQ